MRVSRPVRPRQRRLAASLAVILIAGCGGSAATPAPPATVDPGAVATAAASQDAGPGAAEGTPLPGGPAIATPAEAPTIIEVEHETVLSEPVTSAGATYEVEGATLIVPAGAVAGDTRIEVVRVDVAFEQNPYARDEEGAIAAVPAGPVLDFGPAGVTFDAPVTVTLPYDPAAASKGLDQPAIAYHTGSRWLILGGVVDPVAHTVTVSQDAFEGELLTTILVSTVVGGAIHVGIKWWYGGEGVGSDPIAQGKAADWVTPTDPTVKAAAANATVDGVPIKDPTQLAEYLKQHPGRTGSIKVTGTDGTAKSPSYSSGAKSNWQKPADYLGPNGMKGDCTDVTAAMVSIFRNLGYPARAVFGYAGDKDSPHVWGEVAIGGKAYIIDEQGHLQPLDEGMRSLNLIRPGPDDPRAFMWNEDGQTPYQADWWDATAINGSWVGTLTFTDVSLSKEMAAEAEKQGCTAQVLSSLKGSPLPMTMDITVDDTGKGRAVMKIDMSAIDVGSGKPPKAEPQTIRVTYRNGNLTFHLEQSAGGTSSMTGHLLGDIGGGATIEGTMTFKGSGYSATAAWSVSR